MSITAYEQPRKLNNACWYLNTAKARVINLVGQKLDLEQEKNLFHLSVEQYVEAYHFSLEKGDLEERREKCEQERLPFAQMLGQEPILAAYLKEVMLAIGNKRPRKDEPKQYSFLKKLMRL